MLEVGASADFTHSPATCLVLTFSRFHTLISAIERIKAASAGSSKCRAAPSHISSGTGSGRSLSRVTDSASASAARSESVKNGASRQAPTANKRSSVSPDFLS